MAIANYTFTKSKLRVNADDTTVINGVSRGANLFFRDGAADGAVGPSGQPAQTRARGYRQSVAADLPADLCVEARHHAWPLGAADVYEYPGFRLDFVAREGVTIAGVPT
ncbi:hypothetical protein AB5I41_29150 [Sphingomonas sp. MMS24-JH45]